MHGVSMEMITLPLLLHVQLSSLKSVQLRVKPRHISLRINRIEDCKETLKEIGELASEADDLRAQAVYDCCHFDALLDAGKCSKQLEHTYISCNCYRYRSRRGREACCICRDSL